MQKLVAVGAARPVPRVVVRLTGVKSIDHAIQSVHYFCRYVMNAQSLVLHTLELIDGIPFGEEML